MLKIRHIKDKCLGNRYLPLIFYASDYPYECLSNMMKFVKTLELTEEEKEQLFHLNAEKDILGH